MAGPADLDIIRQLERKVLWLSAWMIHNANHLRENDDGLKVGGHQASSASLTTIMTALYFAALRPEDRVAVKPHASPVFHAIQYLLGNQTREKLMNFRAFGGAQSYPSRTKDTDDVDFSTGSVGLGAAVTVFASLVQDYLHAHGLARGRREGRMVALVGDAELDEGNIFECLLEGWKQGLRNCWWVIDYNRQSLDAVVREGLYERIIGLFEAMGWEVRVLKYGTLLEEAFREPGGERLRDWIDRCPNQLYSALDLPGRRGMAQASSRRDRRPGRCDGVDRPALGRGTGAADDQPRRPRPADADRRLLVRHHDRPVCFVAYTVKGFGLPLQGHKDNHAGLMTVDQMAALRAAMAIREGHEWDRFEGLGATGRRPRAFLRRVPFNREGRRRTQAAAIAPPTVRRAGAAGAVDPAGLRPDPERGGARRQRIGGAHRLDVARRDGVDQSRAVGEPARPLRPRRHLPIPSARSASPRRSAGSSALRASTWSSASPR